MKDWTDEFELKSGLDGFWSLYYQGEEVFSVHGDKVTDVSEDERLIKVVQMWDAYDDSDGES